MMQSQVVLKAHHIVGSLKMVYRQALETRADYPERVVTPPYFQPNLKEMAPSSGRLTRHQVQQAATVCIPSQMS